jgi:hypothetical protein
MAILNPAAAESAGVINPFRLIEAPARFNRADLQGKLWPALLHAAIAEGCVVSTVVPLKAVIKNTNSAIPHAIIIAGVRYDDGKLSFIIHDPLKPESERELTDEELVNCLNLDMPPFLVAPNKYYIADSSKGVKFKTNMRSAASSGESRGISAQVPGRVVIKTRPKVVIRDRKS